MNLPRILVVTGIMASGKSTVAQAIAERLPSAVHLRGDVFRKMIVTGRAAIEPQTMQQAEAQLVMRYELAAAAAKRYAREGFSIVWQDVILGSHLARVAALLAGEDFGVLVLCPTPDAVAEREAARAKTGYVGWTPAMLDAGLRNETPRIGLWLDTTSLTVTQTVDAVFSRAPETRTA
ncbi:MAG TPA: AAA family ATPase [Rhizomicrobium sp.]|nr:AAA family ATPase [Rhizomicrobium sp.]